MVLRKRFVTGALKRLWPLLFFPLISCFSQGVVIDPQNRVFASKEIGFSLTLPPDWRLSKSEALLFTADFEPNGTPLAHLTATLEKDIPSLDDYLRLEPLLTLSQKTQKMAQGELAYLRPLSSRKFEFKGSAWQESIWSGERKGEAKVFHTYTIPVGLNLVQLHFEFPTLLYDGLQSIISPVLEGVALRPPKASAPQVARAYRSMGEVYKAKGLSKEAIDAFNVALENQPDSKSLHLLLGQSYFQTQETDLAQREFLKTLGLDSQNAQAYEGLADVYFKKGLNEKGITAERWAISLSPDNSGLYVKLGEAYLKGNQPQEAIKTYQKLIRRKPDSAEGHLGLGKAYLATDLSEQAILELEQTLKLNPQQTEAHCLLEKAYTQIQSTAEAEQEKKLCPHSAPGPAPSS